MTYRHRAKMMGVQFVTGAAVREIEVSPTTTSAPEVKSLTVEHETGERTKIKCGTIINAAGAHAYHVAKLVGLELPIVPVRHHYFITQPITSHPINPSMPVLRIPDKTLYVRADVNSLLVGGW